MALKIILTLGLPASGKSTYAKDLVALNPGIWKRINKDDMRAMADNGVWSKKNEGLILKQRDLLIQLYLSNKCNVIIDDCNFGSTHIPHITKLAESLGATVEIKDFTNVPLEECLRRDRLRGKASVGDKVILDMYRKYLKPKLTPVPFQENLPSAYIFDIDGTLAIMGDRSPFDWKKVGVDKYNIPLFETKKNLYNYLEEYGIEGSQIIIVSGRDGVCRKETEEWLIRYDELYDDGILKEFHITSFNYYHSLYMRPQGDSRSDTIVKEEIYRSYIEGKFNVLGIWDDRPKVVKMWKSFNLPVYDVGDGIDF